jgi:hypothetical protein
MGAGVFEKGERNRKREEFSMRKMIPIGNLYSEATVFDPPDKFCCLGCTSPPVCTGCRFILEKDLHTL